MRLTLAVIAFGGLALQADVQYTTTVVSANGLGASALGTAGQANRTYLKGKRMMVNQGKVAVIVDYGEQTVTHLDFAAKTYYVQTIAELGNAVSKATLPFTTQVKPSDEQKTVNGYAAKKVEVTMNTTADLALPLVIEEEIWVSSDVPGFDELQAAAQGMQNGGTTATMLGGVNSNFSQLVEATARQIAPVRGVPVEQSIRATLNQKQGAALLEQLRAAKPQLEAEAAKAGPAGDQARQMLALLNGGSNPTLIELKTQASDFRTDPVEDAVFAIPAGFERVNAPDLNALKGKR